MQHVVRSLWQKYYFTTPPKQKFRSLALVPERTADFRTKVMRVHGLCPSSWTGFLSSGLRSAQVRSEVHFKNTATDEARDCMSSARCLPVEPLGASQGERSVLGQAVDFFALIPT